MANFSTATDLIRTWFQGEAQEFNAAHENLMADVGEWVLAAYLQGYEEGYEEGNAEGFDEGESEGKSDGYDEGYEDARVEFENDF